jgi:hypothetical protein
LWLLASESVEGVFDADLDELEFRLRISQKELSEGIKPLITNGFFLDASTMLAVSLQDAIPETEREAERETKYIPPIPKDLLDEWMKIRRKKKAGDVTEIVYNSIKREADKAGWTVEQAITRCCERSWVGFEAEWVKSEIVKPREVRLSL